MVFRHWHGKIHCWTNRLAIYCFRVTSKPFSFKERLVSVVDALKNLVTMCRWMECTMCSTARFPCRTYLLHDTFEVLSRKWNCNLCFQILFMVGETPNWVCSLYCLFLYWLMIHSFVFETLILLWRFLILIFWMYNVS